MQKISIISAIYNVISNENGKEYLTQMFDSIHNQDYENIEHIVIDGASNDGTLEYINFLAKNNAKKTIEIYSQKDSGIYNAMNKGIKKANGDYIAFMNADDYYLKNDAISLLYQAIKKNKNISFSCSDTLVFLDNKKNINFFANINSVFFRMPFCHQSMLCDKELFFKFNFFNESYKICSDYDFITKIIVNGYNGVEVKQNLVLFRYIGSCFKNIEKAISEFSEISFNYYNKKNFTHEDCLNIFKNKLTTELIIKLFIKDYLDVSKYPLSKNKKKLEKYSKQFFISFLINYIKSFKYYYKFRFIFKPIENSFRKRILLKN